MNNYPTKQYTNSNTVYRQDSQPEPIPIPDLDLEKLTPALFDATAKKCAEICSSKPITVSTKGNRKKRVNCNSNASTQLRRFYNELVMWEERTDSVEKLKENLPFIYMIKSKVSYAVGRETVDLQFQDMMNKLINGIKENNIQTLKNAKLFLEAFMGFYKELKG